MQVCHPFVLSSWKDNRRIQSNQLHVLSRSWSNNSANLWEFINSPLRFWLPFRTGWLCSTPSLLVQTWFLIFLHCKCCNSNTARISPFWMCCGLRLDTWTQVEMKNMWVNRKSINPFPKDICVFSVFSVKEDSKQRVYEQDSVRGCKADIFSEMRYEVPRDKRPASSSWMEQPSNFCSIQNWRILLICKA